MRKSLLMFPLTLLLFVTACGEDESAENEAQDGAAPSSDNNASGQTSSTGNIVGTDGTIEAVLNGEQRTWYVTSGEVGGVRQSQSDWRSFGSTMASVSLLGHTANNNFIVAQDAFMIGFTLMGIGGDLSVSQPEISFLSGGMMNRHTSDDIEDPSITVTSAMIDGETLTVSGTFSGPMKFQSMTGGEPADGKTDMSVTDGTFQAVIMTEIDP